MGHVCSPWLQHVDQTIKQKVKTTSLCVTCYPVSAVQVLSAVLQRERYKAQTVNEFSPNTHRDAVVWDKYTLYLQFLRLWAELYWLNVAHACNYTFSFPCAEFLLHKQEFHSSCCPGIFRDVNFSITDLKMEPDNCLAFWKSKLAGKLRNTG